MREYGQIQSSYWNSPKVQKWSDKGKLLGAYLLTGPHTSSLGCMRIPTGYVMEDLGWNKETVSKGFTELFRDGFSMRDESTGWVLIPQFLEWNPIANPNVAKKIQKEFLSVPKNINIYKELVESLKRYGERFEKGFINHLETVYQTLSKQDPTQPYPNQPDPDPDMSSSETVANDENITHPKHQAIDVIEYLNLRTNRNYETCDANLDFVKARLKEGRTIDQCKSVIDTKTAEWLNDEKMFKFLRPATLFNKTKFAQYLGEVGIEKPPPTAKPGSFDSIIKNLDCSHDDNFLESDND